jgi:hypothetical protein
VRLGHATSGGCSGHSLAPSLTCARLLPRQHT